MGKNIQKIKVQGTEISVNLSREEDYISLTDMLKAKSCSTSIRRPNACTLSDVPAEEIPM